MTQSHHNTVEPIELSHSRRFLARLMVLLVGCLSWTWFVRREGAQLAPCAGGLGSAVYAFWHGEQLMMIPLHARKGVEGMASHSSDGAFLARIIELLGYGVIRGSSSRGGQEALRKCVLALQEGRSVGVADATSTTR